jgi:hypothetical protein
MHKEYKTIRRYVIVHYIPKYDYYTLMQDNQGRHHHDDPKEALETAELFKPSLKAKLGIEPEHVAVIGADCWEHGDCCGTVFDTEYVKANLVS